MELLRFETWKTIQEYQIYTWKRHFVQALILLTWICIVHTIFRHLHVCQSKPMKYIWIIKLPIQNVSFMDLWHKTTFSLIKNTFHKLWMTQFHMKKTPYEKESHLFCENILLYRKNYPYFVGVDYWVHTQV